ncbi:WapI family immunity protein [Frondihabitans australicus]|uniref:Uncharacterized protein n=1 Tax=Frondihabitans australicus TaxID=386892 RepID=A0A495IFS2_9MICO|nr:hypothetical protein [Frondihabitans australicus]RKR74191.1 hypothetical protein C8E83_1299 [Frondihabitans australicus]
MRLQDPRSGYWVELSPTRYEFPDGDDSWLVIEGRVGGTAEEWTFRDPALTAVELAELVTWLRECATTEGTRVAGDELWFLEPSLGFELIAVNDDIVSIAVALEHDAAPPSTFEAAVDDKKRPFVMKRATGYRLDFALTRRELASAVEHLAAEAARFPRRATEY